MLTGDVGNQESCDKLNKIPPKEVDMEEYRTINYKGANITVSSTGRIIWNGSERNHFIGNEDGYPCVSIKTEDGWRSISIHRLIALAFVPNPDNLSEVNHLDYNRENFSIENLNWLSHEDNVRYSNPNRPDYTGDKNPNFGNHKLSKIYKQNKSLSKEKQGRPGIQNGRCQRIELYYDGNLIKTFDYMRQCCEYLKEHVVPSVALESIR